MRLTSRVEQDRGNYCNKLRAYYKPLMQSEVAEWIQNYYRKQISIKNKVIYKTSIAEVFLEEKLINKTNNDCINESIREIEIEEKSARSCSQVMQKTWRYQNKQNKMKQKVMMRRV